MKLAVICIACLLIMSGGCSDQKRPATVALGPRITEANGRISFLLPDTSLKRGKLLLWGGQDYECGEYSEASTLFHNQDTTMIASMQVKAYPCDSLAWHSNLADKRQEIMAKNQQRAVIEKLVGDAAGRTVEADYTALYRGQPSYSKALTIYGKHRRFDFWFVGPDDTQMRNAIAKARKSIRLEPTFVQGQPAKHPVH